MPETEITHEINAISSRIAYENRWLRLREDIVRRADGSEGLYGVVERLDFVVVAPLQDGRVTLVEQYRYPVRRRIWEFPMGMWEQSPGIDPAVLAAAELQEETGLTAGRMVYGGTVLQGPGYCNQTGHIFLATELTPGDAAREASEQGMISADFTLAELDAMIRGGVLVDGMTLAALALLRVRGLLA